jgi:hypothetical protein
VANAAGVVLLANEGQTFLSPADLFTVIARILNKKKPDRQPASIFQRPTRRRFLDKYENSER